MGDLRRAPTGGWHGTYLNKLALGVNNYDTDSSTNSTCSSNDDSSNDGNEECFSFDESFRDGIIRIHDGGGKDHSRSRDCDDIEKGNLYSSSEKFLPSSSLKYSNKVMDSLLMDDTEFKEHYGLSPETVETNLRPWRSSDNIREESI